MARLEKVSGSQAKLEEKVAFLEQAVQQLSDEQFAQQKELLALRKSVESLLDKIENQSLSDDSSSVATGDVDERPPHY